MRYILLGGLLCVFLISSSAVDAQETCDQLSCDCNGLEDSNAVSSCESRQSEIRQQCAKSSGKRFGYCSLAGANANRVALAVSGIGSTVISDFETQIESARWSLADYVDTASRVSGEKSAVSRAFSTELTDSLAAYYDIDISRYYQLMSVDYDDAISHIERSIEIASERVDQLSLRLSEVKADANSSTAYVSLLMQAEGDAIEHLARLQLINAEYRASAVNYRVAAQAARDTYVYTLTHDSSWAKRYVSTMMGRFSAAASAYYIANEPDRAKVMMAEQREHRQEVVEMFSAQ